MIRDGNLLPDGDHDRTAARGCASALVAALLLALVPEAHAAPKKKKPPTAAPKRLLEKAPGPITLAIESVDPAAAKVVVRVAGVTRSPGARFFTFHDDRDRHFIALEAACEAAPPAIRCTLDYPPAYLSAHVRGLTLRAGGREVAAPVEEVEARFAVMAGVKPPPPPPTIGQSPRRPPDGGATPPDGGTLEEDEDSRDSVDSVDSVD